MVWTNCAQGASKREKDTLKHSFIDKYSGLTSPVHQLDARLKLVAAFAVILIMVSVPPGQVGPFLYFSFLIVGLALLSRVPMLFVLSRCLLVAPFILIAAAFYPISAIMLHDSKGSVCLYPEVMIAVSIALKAFLSVIMLTLLVSTSRFNDLLHAMRSLKMPKLLGVLSALMYRYVFIIYDEALRTSRARDSRTPGKLKSGRIKTYGNQASMIFLRSWERAHIVYHAMLSRGFHGEFPVKKKPDVRRSDVILIIMFIALFIAIRLMCSYFCI